MKKVKPNKNAQFGGFINYTQKSNILKIEKGITLISLLVMIMLLIILSTVVISGITGKEGIIISSEEIADDYKYQQYKEQVEQLAHNIIVSDSLAGRRTTVTSMAGDMETEDWIKSAIPNEESHDIIVTVNEGYVYQVMYDEPTGMIEVEGLGEEDENAIPSLIASYNKKTGMIEAEAACEGGIARIELIYKGVIVQKQDGAVANFDVEETGWYKVRAVANNGKIRYAMVRATVKLVAPTIVIVSSGEKENDWYGKDNVPVEVRISIEDEKLVGIYYKKNTDVDYTYAYGREKNITIDTSGRTVIYAYGVDLDGAETDTTRLEIKYDNEKPTLGNIQVEPEAQANGWYNENVEITLPNMRDNASGIAGYYYWQVTGDTVDTTQEEKIYVSGATKSVTVESEGETTIAFQAKDNAGNISGISSITVMKDSVAPDDFIPSITSEKSTGFIIEANTQDSISGLAGYYFYVEGVLKNEEISTSGRYEVTGLASNETYTVYVEAVDNAGNRKKSTSVIASTIGDLLAPTITLLGEQGENGCYIGNVVVTIEDSAPAETTGANQIRYTVVGANQIGETTINGRSTSFEITLDGQSVVTAQAINSGSGMASVTSTETIVKDVTPPVIGSLYIEKENVLDTTIIIKGNATDVGSGIASYEFQVSTTSENEGFTTIDIIHTSDETYEYLYTGIDLEKKYYLKVIAKDKAGHTSEKVGSKTIIGSYVDYTPTNGSFSDHVGTRYSGWNKSPANTTLQTDTNLNWRILFAKNGTLTLISDTTTGNMGLFGANGYNNGVLLLNNACKAMYSNSSLGATGRNLSREDIEEKSSYDYTQYASPYSNTGKYGGTRGYSSYSYRYYPAIFAKETTARVNGTQGKDYALNEQTSYITGTSNTSITAMQTYYNYTMNETFFVDNPTYLELFCYESGTETYLQKYWLSTRCIHLFEKYAAYRIAIVAVSDIYMQTLYYSYNTTGGLNYELRPVVDIKIDSVNIGETGDGGINTPYSIKAK